MQKKEHLLPIGRIGEGTLQVEGESNLRDVKLRRPAAAVPERPGKLLPHHGGFPRSQQGQRFRNQVAHRELRRGTPCRDFFHCPLEFGAFQEFPVEFHQRKPGGRPVGEQFRRRISGE